MNEHKINIELEAQIVIKSIRIGADVFPIEAGVVRGDRDRIEAVLSSETKQKDNKRIKHKKHAVWANKHVIGHAPMYGKNAVFREDVEAIERLLKAPGMQMSIATMVKALGCGEYAVQKTINWMKANGRLSMRRVGSYGRVYFIPGRSEQSSQGNKGAEVATGSGK